MVFKLIRAEVTLALIDVTSIKKSSKKGFTFGGSVSIHSCTDTMKFAVRVYEIVTNDSAVSSSFSRSLLCLRYFTFTSANGKIAHTGIRIIDKNILFIAIQAIKAPTAHTTERSLTFGHASILFILASVSFISKK